ncbi:polysaccharide biosynthesis tyrosine autokinase [Arthrobacter sp. EH-1B-1]|uniref:Polysaccharide biosynthesis tyrosine autokinase n=1 Tax=Arthrobacter vasquezii TaxID=2977629 RepID=A0ABT6CZ34_9MICC|nr:polysaccharide biosynthesis tyrosine autokinase [Arthrobacter vasquezii]MDF9278727.1 polysaccharide biosynthesis tyrosine autokinase [Arthrobacter vasquezii]
METSEYLRILRRNWLVIACFVGAGLLIATAYSFITPPAYTSQTKLFAAIQNSGSAAELQQGNSFTQARIQSYAETVDTPVVLNPVIESLGLATSAAELARNIEATSDSDTVLMTIAATDASPIRAAAIAQATSDSLIDVIDRLETTAEGGTSPIKLSVVTPAAAPSSPSSPNLRANLLLGSVAGLLAGLGAALGRHKLDTKIRGVEDLRRFTDASILGGINFDSDATRKPLLTQSPTQSPRAETFRQIRTNLQFAHLTHDSRSVLVTSSLPSEGKSTTAVNLAIAISQAGQSVVLIDADLRRPRVHEYLGLERNAGLTTALIGRAEVNDLLQPWGEDDLYVLTSGQIPPNPSELLGSKRMQELIKYLEKHFDAVIIDAPPLLPVTDAAVLSQGVGGVVMVVGSSRVKSPDLQKSLAALEMVDAVLLGVVLNLLPAKGPDAYSYSYYSSEHPDATTPNFGRKFSSREQPRLVASDFDDKVLRGDRAVPRGTRP